jgi:hypothetical protein
MSDMLEQAIIDAKALREAAIRNAEKEVVERYAPEVKQAVQRLLEEDDLDLGFDEEDPLADPGMGDPNLEEPEESSVMGSIPMAHEPDHADDEIVVIDLDQIIAAAKADSDEEGEALPGEEFEMGRDEIADEIGIEMDDAELADEDPLYAGNRDDDDDIDIDINEEELKNIFSEILKVDIPEEKSEAIEKELIESDPDAVEEVDVATPADDGRDKKDIENSKRENGRLQLQNEALRSRNKELKNLVIKVKDRLEEVNLSNARLLYVNRVIQDPSLNEQQKNKIAELVSEARTAEEAKVIFETLQKTMEGRSTKSTPKSLSEAVSRRSTVILGGHRKVEGAEDVPVKNRWATLAGINNK